MGPWLVIMAAAFAIAIAAWILLVFRAGRDHPGPAQESSAHREVIGGAFEARHGGRQVMPDRDDPIVSDADSATKDR